MAHYTDRDTLTFYREECGQPVATRPAIVNRAASEELAVAHFVDYLVNNHLVESTGKQGLVLIQVIEGVYESAATGREVKL